MEPRFGIGVGPDGEPTLPDVADLVTALLALDAVRSCSMDPADLTSLPAVWVQLRGASLDLLSAATLTVQLYLVVGDTDGGIRAATELVALLNAVLAVVTPDGDVTATVVTMTDGTPRPALTFPVDVHTQPE